MDLVALNVQRGRDHGLAPYVKWRQLCGLRSIKSWKQFASIVTSPEVKYLQYVFNINSLNYIQFRMKGFVYTFKITASTKVAAIIRSD